MGAKRFRRQRRFSQALLTTNPNLLITNTWGSKHRATSLTQNSLKGFKNTKILWGHKRSGLNSTPTQQQTHKQTGQTVHLEEGLSQRRENKAPISTCVMRLCCRTVSAWPLGGCWKWVVAARTFARLPQVLNQIAVEHFSLAASLKYTRVGRLTRVNEDQERLLKVTRGGGGGRGGRRRGGGKTASRMQDERRKY